jgi:hypothetical protein
LVVAGFRPVRRLPWFPLSARRNILRDDAILRLMRITGQFSRAAELTVMLKQTNPAGETEQEWMRTIYWTQFIHLLGLRNPEL